MQVPNIVSKSEALHLLNMKSANYLYKTFKNQPHKMVKRTKIMHRQKPTNCLSEFDHFVGLALKWLNH